jgi:uncharacterized RDD family membrane protein YckC
MTSALDMIKDDTQLQSHWIRRLIALIIDVIIIMIATLIITLPFAVGFFLLSGGKGWFGFSLFSSLLWLLYAIIFDTIKGGTIGKLALKFQVVALDGRMDFIKAVIRNISKVYFLLLILDWIIGFVTDGDPRQKFSDRVANTTVEMTDVRESYFSGPRDGPPPHSGRPRGPPARR